MSTNGTTNRYRLTLDESSGFWWIADELTGQCFETCQTDYEMAREVLATHVATLEGTAR